MNNKFALSPSQRETVHHFSTMNEGDILAVNGPPGTGKTTLLHTIIASLWVEAALEERNPPIILASSTNNQAVTNVIDSFGKIEEQEHPLMGRWIPDVTSYGAYLPSASNKKIDPSLQTIYQGKQSMTGFFKDIENKDYISKAAQFYLDKYNCYAKEPLQSVEEVVGQLHVDLKQKVKEIHDLVTIYANYKKIEIELKAKYPNGIEKAYELGLQNGEEIVKGPQELIRLEQAWNRHLLEESIWYSWLRWIPIVSKRKQLRDRAFILDQGYPHLSDADQITNYIQNRRKELDEQKKAFEGWKSEIELERKTFYEALALWDKCKQSLAFQENEDCLSFLDRTYRYEAFKLATHYWEGKWILEISEQLADANYKESKSQIKQQRMWRRYAKITPCFVSTLYMAPSFFRAWEGQTIPLYEFIDLLIIDEAGQVCPEIAGATFSLAKKALVVGDTLQIEPVWSIPRVVDISNLVKFGLIKETKEAEKKLLQGFSASCGSVMKIAQRRSKYKKYDDVKGMLLTEHRRCVPEIIDYCNKLAYEGRLEPKRKGIDNYPLPHMGYAHIQGQTNRSNGSMSNELEADVIVGWIHKNQQKIINEYRSRYNSKDKDIKIEELVAVITPFSRQKFMLQDKMKRAGLKNVTVGTVHALQGAERPIVIFSPVYDIAQPSSYFFDSSVSMLNVAVSRAQDSFLVFGDMRIFDHHRNTPSGILARYLFASEDNRSKISIYQIILLIVLVNLYSIFKICLNIESY
ncbi:DEAD/DEAH box helicase [Paenibacillus sp. OAS669]|uniref:DEAD/DEAH box helicase n=1 Tax=Paenibacillus sp. OAS669 TaxID=2663821 RepID=UPI001789DA69|nr:DEAD/DEAH box helicase [Paenibacillus sp. OAS669]MBE1444848.1 hypothetical protein [Paenibacillus sp. OAS669]